MEQDIDRSLAGNAAENQTADQPGQRRPTAYFSVRLTLSGSSREFSNAGQAGEAFFQADPAERPTVAHIDGGTARIMARTEIHGAYETGEVRYSKSLPESHAPDAEFRAGFLKAMEVSLSERLDTVDWGPAGRAKSDPSVIEQLDAGLRDDLEAFARREPEKAAALWAERTDAVAPGPELRASVSARHAEADRELGDYYATLAEKPPVIATGDWVTTDQDVSLRPVAVASDRGIHTGYEATLPGGDTEVNFSERTFANSREALRQSYDFCEGGEEKLEIAVRHTVEADRESEREAERAPDGLVVQHWPQPEFPRPETAIYAGADAQLVLTLGRDDSGSRDLADRLVADPEFRKAVGEHIADADATLGTGRFVDGEGSRGFLPDELLAVASYDRNGGTEILAKFPDEGPLSEVLARHLTDSSVISNYLADRHERSSQWEDPAKAISAWVEQSSIQIDQMPSNRQGDLRAEMNGIAREAAAVFGLEQQRNDPEVPPRSTLYSTTMTSTSIVTGTGHAEIGPDAAASLKAELMAAASEAGIDGAKIERRLESGAAGAREEGSWVRSDITDVAARHELDLGDSKERGRAAELVDRFYEKAAELVHAARGNEVTREQNPLLDALGAMTKVHNLQGSVAFRNEDQARDFAEEMKERYGTSVLKDIAAGRTDALAKDFSDPSARQAIATAVIAAAKEHSALGLDAHEAEAAERRLAAKNAPHELRPEHSHDGSRDREF